jgi:hypothetical protein
MTERAAIAGMEARWASPAALGSVCACGARGEHGHCPAKRSNGVPTSSIDDLCGAVLEALRAGPLSGNAIVREVGRRRGAVLGALRALEADGAVRRNGAGWQVAS